MPVAGEKPHARRIPAQQHLEAIVLVSCSHSLPEASLSALVGRHGAMNPAGVNIGPIAKGYTRMSQ